jgi:alanine racemase
VTVDRRTLLGGLVGLGAAKVLGPSRLRAAGAPPAGVAAAAAAPELGAVVEATRSGSGPTRKAPQALGDRFDPWIEVDAEALAHNVGVVSRLTSGRPILAVVKNNAYGLGLVETARLLARHPEVVGFAVVKAEDAIALRDAGLAHDVLLMGIAPDDAVRELVGRGVLLSFYLDDDAERLPARAGGAGPVRGHVYLDTGMSRMGIPFHRALDWLRRVTGRGSLRIEGAFTAFTEQIDFDREQLRRFLDVRTAAQDGGIALGRAHAASSNGVYHLPEAHLDLVRPGIALFGGYPSRPEEEREKAVLEPAVSLKCRVVRVERLRAGDSVSYGRAYIADRPLWIATLPAGHADGYPRGAVEGARVLIGERTYPVIGAVSASHVIVEVGAERTVEVGDVATLAGRGHPDVHPNEVARASGSSVYDRFMHLNPSLPRTYA